MPLFKGSAVALITPFTDTGVDLDAYGRLIDFQLENGTDALVVLGTTGEPSTMTADEKEAVIAFAVSRVKGRVPVIAGTGSNNTAAAVASSVKAQELGADAVLVVTPYYNKATPAGLLAHFTAIADAIDIPVISYNVPSRTGLNMSPATVKAMSAHPRLRAIKEACGSIVQLSELARLTEGAVDLYSGDDNVVLPLLALGGYGVISVAANIVPKQMHQMVVSYFEGDIKKARGLQLGMLPLIDALFCEVNPIPVKTAARLMGMPGGKLRLPLTEMAAANLEKLKEAMRQYGLPVVKELV